MSFQFDDLRVGGQLKVGNGISPAVGEGNARVNGSSHIQGPCVIGEGLHFPVPYATLMVGPNSNPDAPLSLVPGALPLGLSNPYSLCVSANQAVMGNLDVNFRIQCGGGLSGSIVHDYSGNFLAAKKDFDINHPTKDGWRLRHVAPEGPTADVYYRGRVTNTKEIVLPDYWRELVDPSTITVNLTPIGAHQDVIVKGIVKNKVMLQSRGGMPINCFFHVYGERRDCERNISEYEGTSPRDYPGDNSEYLQSKNV
tara:strand:+ start:89 stop:850 length:762 start_codon:yes stop_codon:yes gene_type:complete